MPVKLANLTPYSDKNTHISRHCIFGNTHIYSSTQSFIPRGVEVPSCFRGTACRTAKGTTSSSGEKMRTEKYWKAFIAVALMNTFFFIWIMWLSESLSYNNKSFSVFFLLRGRLSWIWKAFLFLKLPHISWHTTTSHVCLRIGNQHVFMSSCSPGKCWGQEYRTTW